MAATSGMKRVVGIFCNGLCGRFLLEWPAAENQGARQVLGKVLMLKSSQKKYLKGLAHSLKPIVFIGQKGFNEGVCRSVEEALLAHELFKLKFNEHKDKEQKNAILEAIGHETGCELVGVIGHTAILYRAHPEPEKRTITFPAA
jgi:RNA-binding protein